MIWTCIAFIWPSSNFNIQIWNMQLFFDYISYLLDNHLSSFELRKNNMAHLNQCLLLNIKKPKMSCSIIKYKFFVWFTSKHGHKWTSICDQNGIKC
jgi:hypothetical protein